MTARRVFALVLATSLVGVIFGFGVAVSAQAPGPAPAVSGASEADARIWTGVFTTAQAARGRAVYEAYCTRCHGIDMVGGRQGAGGPPLAGDNFWLNWERRTLADLFSKISKTMPQDSPGSLRTDDYSDLLAYVLSGNRFPSGSAEVPASGTGLEQVRIARRAGDSGPAPNFALVQVVGCLTGSSEGWSLTQGTSPAVTREETPSAAALSDAASRPLGSETLVLSSVTPFSPAANAGRRVEVRGLLNRAGSQARLDVLSLRPVSGGCGA
jgi:mono/diheme cytochrome c family protein